MAWPQNNPSKPWNGVSANWMADLDDNLLLRDLSIPGTHDSAALKGWTHFGVSETQNWKVDEQLRHGIRFLDLRVKRKDSDLGELAMWHGSDYVYDYYSSNKNDQLYFRTVIEKCVAFLEYHPTETVIISVKDEENGWDDFWSLNSVAARVYDILTDVNKKHTGPHYRKMWHGHTVDCTLKDVRGKLVLWKRFNMPKNVSLPDDLRLPGTDLTGIPNNTKGSKVGKYFFVQDYYEYATLKDKMYEWIRTCAHTYDTHRGTPNSPSSNDTHSLQIINFLSKAGYGPEYNAGILNPLATRWLNQYLTQPLGPLDGGGTAQPNSNRFRSGIGVVPMDFPSYDLINAIIKLNYQWSFNMMYWEEGGKLWNDLAAEAGKHEK